MTALKPLEDRRVKGVAAERYPINEKCAHPDCTESTDDPHHTFPRSQIIGSSWFVALVDDEGHTGEAFPHVAGLCRKHHDAVELHEAWIKLEDGVFIWYDRAGEPPMSEEYRPLDAVDAKWVALAALNPQPGSREGKPKRKRFQGEARRTRKTISVKVPADTEDGGAVWDETIEAVKERLIVLGLYSEGDAIPVYEALIAALRDWLNG